jgi:SHS2 domain-containing protein
MNRPDWLDVLEHTADEGIVVRAPDLETLFGRAAWGMVSVVGDPDRVEDKVREQVSVSGTDLENLLVNWLSEINVRMQTQGRMYSRFLVKRVSPTSLKAEIGGEDVDVQRHDVHTEIKAVTYHQLKVEEKDGRWEAQVLFDL